MIPTIGSVAPAFSLPDQVGKIHTLSEYKGKWILLYFYPKDETPGCTLEAQLLRDSFPQFGVLNAVIFGISADTVVCHKKFADNQNLPFALLADTEKTMLRAYGVWGTKKLMGREYEGIFRTSFLVAPDGTIAKVYENVKPSEHAAEVLADIASKNA